MAGPQVASTWTRMLSVSTGACAAAGAPGPGTRVRGKAAQEWISGPWLGLFDLSPLRRAEREILAPWLSQHAEPLLLVRHLLLARPLEDDVFIELTPQALEAMPEGWRDAPRPILILAPAGRARPERRREYVDALSRLRLPLVAAGSDLWAIREFDADLMVALAQLANAQERARFRRELDKGQAHLFDQQLPAVEAALLDDLVGGRDEQSALSLDLDTLATLHPAAHPLAIYAALERAQNRGRVEKERTQFSARTIEARLSAQAFPEMARQCPEDFGRAQGLLLLPAELQRIFEASELLAG